MTAQHSSSAAKSLRDLAGCSALLGVSLYTCLFVRNLFRFSFAGKTPLDRGGDIA